MKDTSCFTSWGVPLSMLVVQAILAGLQLLSRVILVQGTFVFALLTYRCAVAAICLLLFAVFFEGSCGQLSTFIWKWKVWALLFLNALTGMTLTQALFYYGVRETSATYSTTLLSTVPIFTFLASIICRMENLWLQTWAGRAAKFVGVILCVGGALVASLYKGKEFYLRHHSHHLLTGVVAHKTHMLSGTLLLVGSCISSSAWFIVQAKLNQVFPQKYWGLSLASLIAAIQSAIVGLIIDHSEAVWRLEWNLQLITILYSGALATAATLGLISWAIKVKGPTYPTMFNPLALIFVAISEATILGQPLGVGTMVGMVLIIMGLYFFLVSKKNDAQSLAQLNGSKGMADGLTLAQTTSTVAPIASPTDTTVVLEIEKIDKN